MRRIHITVLVLALVFITGFSVTATVVTTTTSIPTRGRILTSANLTLNSSPNPSKVGQNVTLSGILKDNSDQPLPQTRIFFYYSYNSQKWTYISTASTDNAGSFSTQWKPALNGRIYIRANATVGFAVREHVVANFIVAADGSGDFSNIQSAIDALPTSGGTAYVKGGTYMLDKLLTIINRSKVWLIGEGYNTKLTRSSGLTLRIENVTNLNIRKLHFHHLTNDHYEAISVRGINDGITIDSNWFTRDQGPLQKYVDLVFFNPNGTTKNLQIKNNFFQYAQIDAMAIKKVIGGTIENNTILDTATNSVNSLGSGMTIEQSFNIAIFGNYIKRTENQSMGGINIFGNSKEIRVERNTITNVEWGVNLDHVSNILVKGNIITDSFSSGVRVEDALNVTISENYIGEIQFDRDPPGIYVINNLNITVLGNTIRNMGSGIMLHNNKWTKIGFNTIDLAAKVFRLQKYGVHLYNSTSTQLYNNTILRAYDVGLAVSMSRDTTITGNFISENQRSSLRLSSSDYSIILQNTLKNNGKDLSVTTERDGIDIISSYYCIFKQNKVFDDQQTKTQLVGLVESGSSDYNQVIENDFRWNALSAMKIVGPHTILSGNLV